MTNYDLIRIGLGALLAGTLADTVRVELKLRRARRAWDRHCAQALEVAR